MSADRIGLSELERRILDRVFRSEDGCEPVEDLLAALGADRNQFVDALEVLEGAGLLSVESMHGQIVVSSENLLSTAQITDDGSNFPFSRVVGQC